MKTLHGNVDLHEKGLRRLPKGPDGSWFFEGLDIDGKFDIAYNNIISLEGCPASVNELLAYGNYRLASLEFIPHSRGNIYLEYLYELKNLKGFSQKIVNGDFKIAGSHLESFKGLPEKIYGDFTCINCGVKSLKHMPKEVYGDFDLSNNPGNFTEDDIRAVCDVHGYVHSSRYTRGPTERD